MHKINKWISISQGKWWPILENCEKIFFQKTGIHGIVIILVHFYVCLTLYTCHTEHLRDQWKLSELTKRKWTLTEVKSKKQIN